MKAKITDTKFGMRVKSLADRVGGISKLARLSGISTSMIKKYISGTADPSRTSLLSLMASGQISFTWLATGAGTMTEDPVIDLDRTMMIKALPEETQRVVDAVLEVMLSDDEGTKLALSQNAFTFQQTVRRKREIEELRNDIEVIKRRLIGSQESDFKTSGIPGEDQHLVKHRGAGKHSE